VVSDSSEFHGNRCPVVSDWSGGVGLVCGMKRGIIDAATTHRRGSIRSADVNSSNLRIEPMSKNRDRPGDGCLLGLRVLTAAPRGLRTQESPRQRSW
jgi:hypothetical protein